MSTQIVGEAPRTQVAAAGRNSKHRRPAARLAAVTVIGAAVVAAAVTADSGLASSAVSAAAPTSLTPGGAIAWSPKRPELAFGAGYGELRFDVFVMRSNGTGVRRVAPVPRGVARFLGRTGPVWSPDGQRVAVGIDSDDGGRATVRSLQVVERTGRRARIYAGGAPSSWAPDSRRLAIQVYDAEAEPSHIGILDLRTGAVRDLYDRLGLAFGPQWSPRGDLIAYTRGYDSDDQTVYVARPDGTRPRRLAAGEAPSWSFDGRLLAYRDGGALYIIGRDGRGKRRLVGSGVSGEHAWSPRRRAVAVVVGRGPLSGRGAFVVDATTRKITRVVGAVIASNAVGVTWSHDGRMLAFTVRPGTARAAVYAVETNGTSGRFLYRRAG